MRAIPQLILGLVLVPTVAVQVGERYASDTTIFINYSPSPTPTGGGPTPTPTPPPAPNWSTIIDHCWNFENNLNDSCTGATPINLVVRNTGVSFTTLITVEGAYVMQTTSNNGVVANTTTELAAPGDTLTMWCFARPEGILLANAGFMGKYTSGTGYALSLLSNTGAEDLLGNEQTRTATIPDVFPTPAPFSFIWWRAKQTSASAICRIGQWSGSATLNSAQCGATATLADATAEKFYIGYSTSLVAGQPGTYDACGWDATNLDDAALCRICSCGVDGSACACSGTTYTNEGRRTTFCGSCTLPACNLSTPGVL